MREGGRKAGCGVGEGRRGNEERRGDEDGRKRLGREREMREGGGDEGGEVTTLRFHFHKTKNLQVK